MELLLIFIPVILLGDFREYPYHTMGGMNILTLLAFGNSKMLYLHALRILKSLTPLSSGFPYFTSTIWNSLFDSLRFLMREILRFYICPEVFANDFQSNNCLQGAKL